MGWICATLRSNLQQDLFSRLDAATGVREDFRRQYESVQRNSWQENSWQADGLVPRDAAGAVRDCGRAWSVCAVR